MGNGEMLCASVMRGTAILPRSEEVCVNIVRREFVRVDVRLASKACRSGEPLVIVKHPRVRVARGNTHLDRTLAVVFLR